MFQLLDSNNIGISIQEAALVAVVFFLIVMLALQFHTIKLLKKEAIFKGLVNRASIGAYYTWQTTSIPADGFKLFALSTTLKKLFNFGYEKNSAIDGYEYFSPALTNVFALKIHDNNFSDISRHFKDDQDELEQKVLDLKNAKITDFILCREAQICEEPRKIQCVGCQILNKNQQVTGIIIWFFDISEYAFSISSLTEENTLLQQELKEFTGIFNTLPMPVWKRGRDLKIRFCNLIYSQFIDNDGEPINNAEIPEFDQNMYNLSLLARDQGKILKLRKHIVINGQRRLFSIVEMPIKNSDEILGFAYDITDQEEIEKELERHISAHSDLLESSSSAIAIYGADTRLRFYNNAFVNLWGLKSAWLDSKPVYAEILEVLRQKRKLPEQVDFKEYRKEQIQRFQDITKPFEEMLHLPDGKALRTITIPHALGGLLFAFEDVTDRLAMERSFNTLIAVQRETLDNLSEAVALFGPDGRIRLYNPVFVKMWNEEPEYLEKYPTVSELLERSKDLLFYRGKWGDFKQKLTSRILMRRYSVEKQKLKNARILNMVTRPLPNGDNLVSYVDVTDSINAEKTLIERNQALLDADRVKTEFIANVSYELRTPLTSIIGFTEALKAEYFGKLNTQQQEYISGIATASSELLSLINDILDLTSIEAGYMEIRPKEFELNLAIKDVVQVMAEHAKKAKLSMKFIGDKTLGKINADETKIKHVIFKLLTNAIKFTKPGGKVTLSTKNVSKNKLAIIIEDTGIGIDSKDKAKLFTPFFRAKNAEQAKKSGTGLGLKVVKNVVELHQGKVEIKSRLGVGTKVVIYLKK